MFDLDPAWLPDGTKIAFEKGDGNQYEVYVVNADGSGLTNLTNTNSASDLEPSWSPDGQKIAFSSTRAGTNDIFMMNADGSGPTNLTNSANAGEVEADWGNIEDTTAPMLDLPVDITEVATSASGATVTFTTTATDDVDGSVPVNCSSASGSLFATGTTQVSCSATDVAGNQASGFFQVKVVYDFGNGSGGGFGEPVRDTELNKLAAGACL